MRDFPRHFFASSTSSRVNSSVASYAFSQSCDDQDDRKGTWSNLGETFGKKPWKIKKTWEKWGKNGETYGKIRQFAVKSVDFPSRIMGKLLKSLFSSLKFNLCRWRSPLFFLITASVSVGPCFSQIFVDSIATIKAILVAYSDPSLFSFAPLEMYFEQFTPYLLDCTFHVLCGILVTMLQIIIDSSKSVVE